MISLIKNLKNKFSFLIIFLILIYLIKIYYSKNYNKYKPFIIKPGNIMITNRTHSSWQFIKPLKYEYETLSDLYIIKYYNIINTTLDGYLSFKGNIVIFNKNNTNTTEYVAVFKDSLISTFYNDLDYYFHKKVEMNDEIYKININNGLLQIILFY